MEADPEMDGGASLDVYEDSRGANVDDEDDEEEEEGEEEGERKRGGRWFEVLHD